MAITIVVETGDGMNLNANSYIDVDYAIAFATNRGELFPTDPDEVASNLIKAMDYLESLRSRYQGKKTSPTQPLAWPRSSVEIDGEDFPNNAIPVELKLAQAQLAVDAYALGDLSPSSDGYAVAREKVDVLEVEYATGGRMSNATLPAETVLTKAMAWLEPLFDSVAMFSTVRV